MEKSEAPVDMLEAARAALRHYNKGVDPMVLVIATALCAVVAAEREACARVAEHYADESGYAFHIAREIRERA